MQGLARLVGAPGIRALSGNVMGHGLPVGSKRSTVALSSCIRQHTSWAKKPGNDALVEVVIHEDDTGLDPYQKQLADVVKQDAGTRCLCIASANSVWCNEDDSVEDVLEVMKPDRAMSRAIGSNDHLGLKNFSSDDVITANVYYHHAKHIIIDGISKMVIDMVRPKFGVVRLRRDTILWQAQAHINEMRRSMQMDYDSRNDSGNYFRSFEIIHKSRSGDVGYYVASRRWIDENRLLLKVGRTE